MSKQVQIGACHICGHERELSFEHVPPKAAFNRRSVRILKGESIVRSEHDPSRGGIQQKGAGGYTSCKRCNNDTGRWYGGSYVEWACLGMGFMPHAMLAPSLVFPYAVRGNLDDAEPTLMSEISFSPFGYVMCVDSPRLDPRLVEPTLWQTPLHGDLADLSFFAQSGYDETRELHLRLPILPVCTAYPADLRTAEG